MSKGAIKMVMKESLLDDKGEDRDGVEGSARIDGHCHLNAEELVT